ncbi:GTP pyrophosphokinase [Brachybacterium sp. AOP25-B2-12]|uniref:GTP pyrophosphokinase n=1 Tax=Brachybacterium sp. AOP25-B2-12 TaxID=3457710 RepID=UPI0040336152
MSADSAVPAEGREPVSAEPSETALPSHAEGSVVPWAIAHREPLTPETLRSLRDEYTRFMLRYEYAIREVETKVSILNDDFSSLHDHNPIEHVSSRVKSADSILAKARRLGIGPTTAEVGEHLLDIAGVRVTCSFVRDTYRVLDLLQNQDDLSVRVVKDYIAHPKPNGYRSLHAIVDVPVYLATERTLVPVEIQIRTIAMDFWASLEHKIYYKYDGHVPQSLLDDLTDAAESATELDVRMERIHTEVHGAPHAP